MASGGVIGAWILALSPRDSKFLPASNLRLHNEKPAGETQEPVPLNCVPCIRAHQLSTFQVLGPYSRVCWSIAWPPQLLVPSVRAADLLVKSSGTASTIAAPEDHQQTAYQQADRQARGGSIPPGRMKRIDGEQPTHTQGLPTTMSMSISEVLTS